MTIETFNRYETKFLIDRIQFEAVRKGIANKTVPDAYNVDGKVYTICNIYYDTDDSLLIRTSLSKPKYKEKLRLRSYGIPKAESSVFLEIKKKYAQNVNKRRTKIGIKAAEQLVTHGIEPPYLLGMNMQVLEELKYFVSIYDLKPMVYIAYDRQAYVGIGDKTLRITFDKNIRTRRDGLSLEYGDYGTPLLKEGIWLMEIKCSSAIPLWLTAILSENKIYKISFSKYGEEYKQYLNKTSVKNTF